MTEPIRVCWERKTSRELHIYVILADAQDDTKFFGMGFCENISPVSNTTSERTAVGNFVKELLVDPPDVILRNLLITFKEFDKSITKGLQTLWIKDKRYMRQASMISDAWQKLQDSKTQYLPKGWPLSSMKPIVRIENPDEIKEDDE